MIGMGRVLEGAMAQARGETPTQTLGEVGARNLCAQSNTVDLYILSGLALDIHERPADKGPLRSTYV